MPLSPLSEIPAQNQVPDSATPPNPAPQGRIVMTKIFVTGLKVDAEIGVYAHEKGHAQPLVVDVELDVPSAGTRKLADTVNYEMVGEAARAIAAQGHIHLVEDFAERLARACLADERVMRARVRVEKPLALAPHAMAAGVEITVVRG
jgi:dihydroneopterin aldolase